jgi:hypothetical protein
MRKLRQKEVVAEVGFDMEEKPGLSPLLGVTVACDSCGSGWHHLLLLASEKVLENSLYNLCNFSRNINLF